MRINDIITGLINLTDGILCLLFCTEVAVEVCKLCFHLRCNGVLAAFWQCFHQLRAGIRILACNTVDQTLQVAGNQNVHRRRAGKDEISLTVISTSGEEVKQYLVLIGCTDQLLHRKSHLFRIECCQNVSEVSCRYYHVDLLAGLDLALADQCGISVYIIYDLRNKTSDINGVGGRKLEACIGKLCCHLLVIEHFLHCCLGIVKVACDADYVSIGALLGHHLLLLDGAYAVLRVKYNNSCARNIRKTSQCSLAGISWGRCKNDDLIFHVVLLRSGGHQVWQNRQCHILERNGRSVEQLQEICTVCFLKRCDHICIKFLIICTVNTGS